MTEFYVAQKKAYNYLEEQIKAAGSEGIDSLLLLYQTTLEYAISEKKVLERLDLMLKSKRIKQTDHNLFWIFKSA